MPLWVVADVRDPELAAVWAEPDAWISASEAIKFVRAETLSLSAHIVIATRAHAGLLRARADLIVINEKQRHIDVEVPAKFWWAEGDVALKQNWEVGDFSTWIDRRVQYQIFGVRFLREDLKRLVPARPAALAQQPPQAQRHTGGRPMSELWPDWVAELVSYIHDHGIPPGSGSTGADDLISRVDDRLSEKGLDAPSRSTVLVTAKAVLRRLRDGN